MKKEVIEKIDLLVEMSGTTNKYETLNEELTVVDSKIELEKDKYLLLVDYNNNSHPNLIIANIIDPLLKMTKIIQLVQSDTVFSLYNYQK